MRNTQTGPQHASDALAEVVSAATYKAGWEIWLAHQQRPSEQYTGSEGLTLCIAARVPDSTRPGETVGVEHWIAVPPTSWERPTWERWLLDQLLLVETHEAMEFYAIDGHKPYFPAHGPGRDPYAIERKP